MKSSLKNVINMISKLSNVENKVLLAKLDFVFQCNPLLAWHTDFNESYLLDFVDQPTQPR